MSTACTSPHGHAHSSARYQQRLGWGLQVVSVHREGRGWVCCWPVSRGSVDTAPCWLQWLWATTVGCALTCCGVPPSCCGISSGPAVSCPQLAAHCPQYVVGCFSPNLLLDASLAPDLLWDVHIQPWDEPLDLLWDILIPATRCTPASPGTTPAHLQPHRGIFPQSPGMLL